MAAVLLAAALPMSALMSRVATVSAALAALAHKVSELSVSE